MFFEQNLLEPNVGTARFWRLTRRDGEQPEAFARHLEAGAGALAAFERGLAGRLPRRRPGDTSTTALARVHRVVPRRGTSACASGGGRLARAVAATPGAIDDLEPYPAAAHAGAGGRSAHDR